MEDTENPYTILGVEKNATQQQIKSAYRKLALKHHPDKQSTEEGRKQATVQFAKIANAYEILGDEVQRQNYDRDVSQKANRPRSKQPRRYTTTHQEDFFHHTQFHDPFSVFESVFRDEFGSDFFRGFHHHRPSTSTTASNGARRQPASPFDDPFFSGGSLFGNNDPFARDPFAMGGMGMGMGMMSPLGGGSMFAAMNQQMNQMMNMHTNMMMMQQQQQQQQQQQAPAATSNRRQQLPRGGQGSSSFVFTSSSNLMTSGNGRNGGETVTNSTTTRIVNGKKQVVQERIVQKPDGTVERHVDLSGDDDDFSQQPPRLRSSQQQQQPRQALEAPPSTKQQQQEQQQQQQQRRRNSRSLFKRKRRDSSSSKLDG